MKFRLLVLFVFSFLFQSCDPIHFITFENKSNQIIKVLILKKHNSDFNPLNRFSSNDSVYFSIKPNDNHVLYFGTGNWSDVKINELSEAIDKVKIENDFTEKTYKSHKAIKHLLTVNRNGIIFENEIKIVLDEV